MNRRKKAFILSVIALTLQLSGCNKTNDNDNKINETNITQQYNNTIEKEFDIGEHFVTVTYKDNSNLIPNLYLYAEDSFNNLYIPEGYSIFDFEYLSNKGTTTALCVVFVNNKKVSATGVLKEDGKFHFDEFGQLVKEKTLTK